MVIIKYLAHFVHFFPLYKMVVEQIIAKNKSPHLFSNSVFLKDFDSRNLKITKHNCGNRYVYYLDYVKDIYHNNFHPLHIIIPDAKGFTSLNDKGRRCLNVCTVDYFDMWIQIIMRFKAINNGCKKEFAVDYYDISLDGLCIDLLLDKMIRFNAMVIYIRLIISIRLDAIPPVMFNLGSSNSILACTDFRAHKRALRARSCMQNYVSIKQSLWVKLHII